MRTKNSIINILASMGAQGLNIILQFVGRKIFLLYFTEEYLGVNGLFTELLNVFSLAELGIGTAMMYGLYEAVAGKSEERICRLMNLYRKLYRYVGVAVAVCGTALLPFLHFFIKDNTIPHIHLIYLMYLLNSVLSYFYSYKQTIIQAYQKSYIISGVTQGTRCVQILVQIVLIFTTKNFYVYLGVQILTQVVINILLAGVADRMYPYLKKDRRSLPEKEERAKIYQHIRAMAIHRFGAVFVLNTDNLIISSFVGLGMVGLYSNYRMVINSLKIFAAYIYSAFTAGIGELAATESSDRVLEVYHCLNFCMSLLYGWMAVCLLLLLNPFIEIVFGGEFVLGWAVVLTIVADFYIHGMRQMTLSFRNAMGLFWHDRWKPLFEVPLNLVISLLLVNRYQITGVLLGTIISSLLVNFWVEPYVFFRYGIKQDWKKAYGNYFLRYGTYFCFAAAAGAAAWKAIRYIPAENIWGLAVQAVVISAMYGVLTVLAFGRTGEAQFIWKKIVQWKRR